MHLVPAVPHVPRVAGRHVAPLQHPLGQVTELQLSQTPAVQPTPPQLSHAAPPLPHLEGRSPGRQLFRLQQPAHERPSHTQVPPSQRCPVAHAAPTPHAQLPLESQPSPIGSQETHASPPIPHEASVGVRHTSPSQQPPGHDVASHTHELVTHR